MRDPWVIVSLFAIALLIVATPMVLVGMALAEFSNSFSHIGARKHLKPIPIAASACPYVALMHAAADNYQNTVPMFWIAIDANGHLVPWATERPRLDATLRLLDGSIKVSTAHFPAPIRAQLAVTESAIDEGRVQLAHARDLQDVMNRSQPALDRGQRAFGFASDLVGRQCRVRLAAGSGAPSVSTTVPSRSK